MADSPEEWTTKAIAPVPPGMWVKSGPVVAVLVQEHKTRGEERITLGYLTPKFTNSRHNFRSVTAQAVNATTIMASPSRA
jgi:hypothetical protein